MAGIKQITDVIYLNLSIAYYYIEISRFRRAAISFALGHICFVAAYSFLYKIKKWDYLISAFLFTGCLIFLLYCSQQNFDNYILAIVCIFYALIISFMVGKAIGNIIQNKTIATITIAFSSLLFLFSDIMLILGWFFNTLTWADNACLATYYPALSFLAFSMFLTTLNKSK